MGAYEAIYEALDSTFPETLKPARLSTPAPEWLRAFEADTTDWLFDFEVDRVEIAMEGDFPLETDFRSATVSVLSDKYVAQGIIRADETGNFLTANFSGWKIVPKSAISTLELSSYVESGRTLKRISASFKGLDEIVVVPSSDYPGIAPEALIEAFQNLRKFWLDNGGSASLT